MPIEKLRPRFTFTEDRLAELRAVVPEAFADGKVNWEALRLALGDSVEEEGAEAEHFGLFWPGKRQALKLAAMPSKGTLVPAQGEGVNEATTRNLFIEGDNLEVLKLLLKSYAGRVKMIYIDPPYNTGNDFVYVDDFRQPLDEYLRIIGQIDDAGRPLTTNLRTNGRFHSTWLNLMYPRLRLARSLLQEDGVVFISVDDNEVHHLRAVMDELFGEEAFLANIIVQSNKRGQTYKQISKTHEYLFIYTVTPDAQINELEKVGESDDLHLLDELGRFNTRELRNRNPKFGRFNRPNLYYEIFVNPKVVDKDGFSPISLERSSDFTVTVLPMDSKGKEGCWRWGRKLLTANIGATTLTSNVVAHRKQSGDYGIYEKYRKTTYKAKSIWSEIEVISEKGTVELGQLGLTEAFDFPKPASLVKRLLLLATESNGEDLVLDFFAGSCTTAHALLALNQEDGGNRKFIMVQLAEPTPEGSTARQAGYASIAEVGKERIRRVIAKVGEEKNGQLELSTRDTPEDLGFKVFKLSRSNFKAWNDYTGERVDEVEGLFDAIETPLVEGWKEADLLTEVMLLEGFPLDSVVTPQPAFTDNRVSQVASDACDHCLYVCLDPAISDATIGALSLRDKDVFICLDHALGDEAKLRLSDVCNLRVI